MEETIFSEPKPARHFMFIGESVSNCLLWWTNLFTKCSLKQVQFLCVLKEDKEKNIYVGLISFKKSKCVDIFIKDCENILPPLTEGIDFDKYSFEYVNKYGVQGTLYGTKPYGKKEKHKDVKFNEILQYIVQPSIIKTNEPTKHFMFKFDSRPNVDALFADIKKKFKPNGSKTSAEDTGIRFLCVLEHNKNNGFVGLISFKYDKYVNDLRNNYADIFPNLTEGIDYDEYSFEFVEK
jgi:hypothetical protein